MFSYEDWRQDDPGLNETEAWPKSIFPEAEYAFFRDGGCLICSLAVLLHHCGMEKNEGERHFNPWILNQRLIAQGAFTPAADLELAEIQKLYPLRYKGAMPYSRKALEHAAENGLPSLITVPGIRAFRHFIALLQLTSDDAVVFDPLYGERKLSEYDRKYEIRVFERVN